MVNNSYKLDEICVSKQKPRTERRINGLQLPLHPQQVIGWSAILIITIVNFTIIVPTQCERFQDIAWVTLLILHSLHMLAHVTALLLDPAENQLRQLSRSAVPEFDRSVHAHVIENGRCHLCNIQTSSKNTKHCSICNKCVYGFDHHCKWLNHCIGTRNYVPFFLSVSTATVLSFIIAIVCLVDVVSYFVTPELLSSSHRRFIELNGTKVDRDPIDWTFISVLTLFGFSNSVIGCVLMHLCAFHIYIKILGVSTYEYIVRNVDVDDSSPKNKTNTTFSLELFRGETNPSNGNKRYSNSCYKTFKCKDNRVGNAVSTTSNDYEGKIHAPAISQTGEARDIIHKSTINNNGSNVTNLMAIIINKVNSKNKLYYKQPVHPTSQTDNTGDVISNFPSNVEMNT